MLACCTFGRGNIDIVSILIGCGANPAIGIEYKLFLKIKHLQLFQDNKMKKQFGSKLENKNVLEDSIVYPLDLAVSCGNKDIVMLLLKTMNRSFVFASYYCLTLKMDSEIIVALCEYGANIKQTNQR